MKKTGKGTLFFYGLPAYGHTFSNLYLAGRLAEAGFRVVYYSAEPFREAIEGNGCEYRDYPIDWKALDLTDGERILKLYRLLLEYTWKMLPELLKQVREEQPCGVVFDSLALWGRAVGQICSLPGFAFYSIAAIDWTWSFPWGYFKSNAGGQPANLREKELSVLSASARGRKYGVLPVSARGRKYGVLPVSARGRKYGVLPVRSRGRKYGVLPVGSRGRKRGVLPVGSRGRKHGVLPVSPWGKGLGAYASGFLAGFLEDAGEIPRAVEYAGRLSGTYGLKKLGLLQVLMNRGDYNLCGYSRLFQPGGRGFGQEYRFVGPLSVHRKATERGDFSSLHFDAGRPLVYISLGTIFNRDEKFLQAVIEQFGRHAGEKGVQVVLVCEGSREYPENFIVRPFVDQSEILKHASLFITAGGLNSIHEALYFGVPCLLCPQQGEQRLNAKQFEKLGFGKILKDLGGLKQEAMECMELKKHWDEKRRERMTAVSVGKALELFEGCSERTKNPLISSADC